MPVPSYRFSIVTPNVLGSLGILSHVHPAVQCFQSQSLVTSLCDRDPIQFDPVGDFGWILGGTV